MQDAAQRLETWMIRRGHSRRTAQNYAGHVRRYDRAAKAEHRTLAERASIEDVQDYCLTLKATYATRAGFQNAMRRLWTMAGRDKTPLSDLAIPPKRPMTCRAISEDETPRMLAAARERGAKAYAAACLMYYAGLRVHEAAGARWDWDRGDELIVVGKGARTRWLPVHEVLRAALDSLPRETEWMFPGRNMKGHICEETARQWIRLTGAAAGFSALTPHQLRHTSLATMNDRIGDLRATAEFAGHSPASLSVTMGYTRTTRARMRLLAAAL